LLTYPLDLTIFLGFFQAQAYPSNLGSWVQHLPSAWVSRYWAFLYPSCLGFKLQDLFLFPWFCGLCVL
jgi:hypothetical protein